MTIIGSNTTPVTDTSVPASDKKVYTPMPNELQDSMNNLIDSLTGGKVKIPKLQQAS